MQVAPDIGDVADGQKYGSFDGSMQVCVAHGCGFVQLSTWGVTEPGELGIETVTGQSEAVGEDVGVVVVPTFGPGGGGA